MRLAEIAGEAWRNVTGGTARAGLLATVCALLLCGLMYLEASTVTSQVAAASRFRDTGGSTWVLEAPGAIDGLACQQLAGVDGVWAAAPIRELANTPTPLAARGQPLTMYQAGLGLSTILTVPARPGLYVSAALATTYALSPGSILHSSAGPLPVVDVFSWPQDGRIPLLSHAAVILGPTSGSYDQCWASFDPIDPNKRALLSIAVLPTSDGQSQMRQLASRYGEDPQFGWYFDNRLTRWAPLAALLLGAFVTATALWLRKVELATCRHFGMTIMAQLLQCLMETVLWVLAVLVLCAGVITVWAVTVAAYPALALYPAFVCLSGAVGALLGSVLAPLAVRERSLSSYVKTR